MFVEVAAFEFRYQIRQPAFWVIVLLFGLASFGLIAASENISLSGGATHVNAPYVVALSHMILALLFMLATTAIVANAVSRDVATGFAPMIQSSHLTKFGYLYGRFAGAFGAVALCYCAVPIGMMLGLAMPWLDPETLGPFRLHDFTVAYLALGLPSVFLTSATFFVLATVTRSMMATYLGVVAYFILYMTLTSSLDRPEFRDVLVWIEPFGLSALEAATRYWTPADRNMRLPSLDGVLLYNRLLWTGVGLALLALAYGLFRPEADSPRPWLGKRRQAALQGPPHVPTASPDRAPRLPAPTHNLRSAWTQMHRRTGFEMGLIFKNPAFAVLMILGVFNAVGALLFAGEILGAPTLLVTRRVIQLLGVAFGLVSIIVAIYYAGELIWRDKERRIDEILDSTSAPDWTFLAPKVLALALVLISILVVAALSGVAVQLYKGDVALDLDQYLYWYILPEAANYMLLAVLAVFVQAVSPNKFVGWAVMAVYLVSTIVQVNLGLDHLLYRYGATPSVPLSDMNGRGHFGAAANWLTAYWSGFAALLMILTYGLWRRGVEPRFRPRLRRLRRRLAGPTGLAAGATLVTTLGLGAFVFVNTNVWNDYHSRAWREERQADYEKTLLGFETTPQASIVNVALDLDLSPHDRRLATRGRYLIENRTGAALREVHLRWRDRNLKMLKLDVQGAHLVQEWPRFDYRIYRFSTPMAPGERRTITFETLLAQRGFANSSADTALVDNGSFVNNTAFAPQIGMSREGLLSDRVKRRRYGLPAELRMHELENRSARNRNFIGADWVQADITIHTAADQTPVAPGYKVSDVVRNGRRTARFVTEAPILHFFSVQSAAYNVARERYKDVELAVYHHPGHARNVPRMIAAMKAGLDYFEPAFGDYQFRQARITEFPYGQFAQAFANTMPYSENLGFIADFRDPEKIDYVTYVTAHELAHQWWAHQVAGADTQGSASLSESLAQYSALMVMRKTYGPDHMRRFMKYELDTYLKARGGERLEELPLFRVENQDYIYYRKGGLILYLLADQIGEDRVNAALRDLIKAFGFKSAPYPRSVDLIDALRRQAPPSKQALITDLFERITLYDLKMVSARSRRRSDDRWDTTVIVEARKFYADGQGDEIEAPLNESVDIGLFAADPGERGFTRNDILAFEPRPLKTGRQTLHFITSGRPFVAGVDPYNKWIDRDSADNLKTAD